MRDRLRRQTMIIFTNFRGTPVAQMSFLRRLLKKDQAEYAVAKKTLFDRALKDAGSPQNIKALEGEIGFVFAYGEQNIPAKTLVRFSKNQETMHILGGILGERVLDHNDIISLASIPSREILLLQVARAFVNPIQSFVQALQGNLKNFVSVLENIKNKKSRE